MVQELDPAVPPRRQDNRRFKRVILQSNQMGLIQPYAGNCIQVRKCGGVLTYVTNEGDTDVMTQGETVRFDTPFQNIKISSTMPGDVVELSIGYGLKFNPTGSGGGGSVGNSCCPAVIAAEYRQPTGVAGGAAAGVDAWFTYPLNTLAVNDNSLASFNGVNVNDIDLPPGVYEIRAGRAMILHYLDGTIRVIRPDTGAILGQAEWFFSRAILDQADYPELVVSRFTLNALTSIRMQYFVDGVTASDANDLGYALNGIVAAGLPYELYGNLWIAKIG